MLSPWFVWNHPLPQDKDRRALNFLIRFYISIEDGECPVERDVAAMCGFSDAHQNVDRDLADDLLLVKTAPTEVADICLESPPDSETHASLWRLGPASRRWATLWRELFGVRLGIHSFRQKVKGKVPGSYNAARSGVLAAADYTGASKMQNKRGHQQDAGDVLEGLGVSKSFLESAIGDRGQQYENKKYEAFRNGPKTRSLPLAHLFAR